jgi:hypothetical protein
MHSKDVLAKVRSGMIMNNVTARHHLGTGRLTLRREMSVFINCPYDEEFRPLFDAIVFSSICCGFIPRCAIESGTASLTRMDRIVTAIRASKYSIHDLSRCKGEGKSNLARFNMPLELGIAMGEKFGGYTNGATHDWLTLVPKGHQYAKYVSDLAGYDPSEHEETVETIVPIVMAWLATREDAVNCPSPQAVLYVLPEFQAARAALCAAWCGHEPWPDLLLEGIRISEKSKLIPSSAEEL